MSNLKCLLVFDPSPFPKLILYILDLPPSFSDMNIFLFKTSRGWQNDTSEKVLVIFFVALVHSQWGGCLQLPLSHRKVCKDKTIFWHCHSTRYYLFNRSDLPFWNLTHMNWAKGVEHKVIVMARQKVFQFPCLKLSRAILSSFLAPTTFNPWWHLIIRTYQRITMKQRLTVFFLLSLIREGPRQSTPTISKGESVACTLL